MLSVLIGCVLLTQTIAYPVENDEYRNFGLSKTYFSNFDIEHLNPFNWISGNRNSVIDDDDDDDVKFEKFFKIIECLVKDGNNCARLVDEVKPYFVKTKNKKSTTVSSEETSRPATTTNPPITTETFNQK